MSREKCHSDATTTTIKFEDIVEVVPHPEKPHRFALITTQKHHKLRAEAPKLAQAWIKVLSIPIKQRQEEAERHRAWEEAEAASRRKKEEAAKRAEVRGQRVSMRCVCGDAELRPRPATPARAPRSGA